MTTNVRPRRTIRGIGARRTAALAIAAIMLIGAAPVFADCGGWVLWRNSVPSESQMFNFSSVWEIESGAPDYRTCMADMKERVAFYLKHLSLDQTRRTLREDLVETFDSNGDLYEGSHFVCLPDTIDPRQSEKRTGGE